MAQMVSIFSLLSTLSIFYFLCKSVASGLESGIKPPNLKLEHFTVPDASALVDDRTYDEWYQSGMTAYTNEEWASTIWYFENGLKEFKYYRTSLVYCRVKCSNITKVPLKDDGVNHDLNEQRYFQTIFKKALCIRKCKFEKLGSRPDRINPEITDKFLSRTPYSYLQFAYYKHLDYEKAVAAAYTFVQANPDDSVMYNNLEYYRNLHGILDEHLIDLEEKNHNKHFHDAYTAYEIGNWSGVIYHMESALSYYWVAEEECRAMCEGKYENREFMDLYEAMANHYASTLFCKDQCEVWLSTIRGKVVDDYLPNHFHFLQFAYFHDGNINAAVSAASAFLLLRPDDETMKSNMAYYENESQINKYTLQPRQDVQVYKERLDLEREMLKYARSEFWDQEDEEFLKEVMSSILNKNLNYDDAEPIKSSEVRLRHEEEKEEEKKDENVDNIQQDTKDEVQDGEKIDASQNTQSNQRIVDAPIKNTQSNQRTVQTEKKKQEETIKSYHLRHGKIGNQPYEPSGPSRAGDSAKLNLKKHKEGDLNGLVKAPTEPIEIFQEAAELNGTARVAADGIASKEECSLLIKLLKMESKSGDGYKENPYVHTKYELFEGLTVYQATEAAKYGRLSLYYPLTYMHVAERSRQFVQDYFKINQRLYFSYTHLVCRTAEPDSTRDRKDNDMSHPIHADNCQLDYFGNCHKKLPAFTWRDYSAVTYLNDDFEGGDFLFAHANLTVQATVKPTCGRIVAFSAGFENLHGVKSVVKGRRCALALWFTLDSRYREREFFEATTIINELYDAEHDTHDEL